MEKQPTCFGSNPGPQARAENCCHDCDHESRCYYAGAWDAAIKRQGKSRLTQEELIEGLEANGVTEGHLDGTTEGIQRLPYIRATEDAVFIDLRCLGKVATPETGRMERVFRSSYEVVEEQGWPSFHMISSGFSLARKMEARNHLLRDALEGLVGNLRSVIADENPFWARELKAAEDALAITGPKAPSQQAGVPASLEEGV